MKTQKSLRDEGKVPFFIRGGDQSPIVNFSNLEPLTNTLPKSKKIESQYGQGMDTSIKVSPPHEELTVQFENLMSSSKKSPVCENPFLPRESNIERLPALQISKTSIVDNSNTFGTPDFEND